jgi:hypothetical protein
VPELEAVSVLGLELVLELRSVLGWELVLEPESAM